MIFYYIFNAYLWICLIWTVTTWTIYIVKEIKCRKIKGCKNDDCKLRKYCNRTAWSDKEIAEVKALIDSLKDE